MKGLIVLKILQLKPMYFSSDRIKVVNSTQSEIAALTEALKSYMYVSEAKWIKNITYAFRVKTMNEVTKIGLISRILIHLHRRGWNPMTPITMGNDEKNMIITICFEKSSENSSLQKSPKRSNIIIPQESCSIEYTDQTMTLHSVPPTVLLEFVNICQDDILAISSGVMSIISDYMSHNIPVINADGLLIKFKGNWKNDEVDDSTSNQKIISCLSKAGYNLSIVIYFGATRAVYFFIVERKHSKELRQLTKQTAGLGLKDSLTSYQPVINRRKSSFFGSFKRNRKASLTRRVMQNLHQKFGGELKLSECASETESEQDLDQNLKLDNIPYTSRTRPLHVPHTFHSLNIS